MKKTLKTQVPTYDKPNDGELLIRSRTDPNTAPSNNVVVITTAQMRAMIRAIASLSHDSGNKPANMNTAYPPT
jgi:hypothetical protein